VGFEMALTTATARDLIAGPLNRLGAKGGTAALVRQPFFISINSSIHFLLPEFEPPGGLVTPGDGQFTPDSFNLFDALGRAARPGPRASIARGQAIFNTRPINITGVAGINDDVSVGGLIAGGLHSLPGTCGTCHDTRDVGNHSFPTSLNIGTGDLSLVNPSVNLGGL